MRLQYADITREVTPTLETATVEFIAGCRPALLLSIVEIIKTLSQARSPQPQSTTLAKARFAEFCSFPLRQNWKKFS